MATDDNKVSINIRCSNGSKFFVRVELNCTVGAFKSIIADNCDVPVAQQRLIYKGRILKDEHTLESYGVQSDHTVHLVRGSVPSPSTNPPSIIPSETPNVTASATDTSDGAGLRATGIGGSLFPSFNGSLPTGLFPELGQMQQQLAQDPNMMRDIMNMPAVESILSNPDLLRSLIMSNPQMREVIDRNPEFGHALNDPSTLRQTLEAARNPEIMREIMRNTDRAMSNIESSPEGFNMLRRMYETVQEPFLNATSASRDVTNPGTNPFAALLGNQSVGQDTNRSSIPTTPLSETTADSLAPNTNPLPNPWSSTGGSSPANTTAPRSNATGGLGGLGLPQLEVTGGLQDPSSLFNQMMQNPAFTQFMQSFLSNPQYMDQILSFNPQLRTMMDSNPQLRTLMQNPEFIRRVTSPETMQQYLSLHQMLTSQQGRNPPSTGQGQTGNDTAITGTANLGFEALRNMFAGVGAGGLGSGGLAAPNTPNVPPEELYATQLSQLQEMGFMDTQENIRALTATGGNVHAAVERLLGNFGHV